MKKRAQLELIPRARGHRFFGGQLLKGRRKTIRPLSRNEAMHFVLRSEFATGRRSFRKLGHLKTIERILLSASRKYGVKIYRQAIQSNHIHLIVRVPNRRMYRAFIAVVSGKIASLIMGGMSFKNFLKSLGGEGCLPTQDRHKGQAFWDYRPFHRIIAWGRDYAGACAYLMKNQLEALGFIAYTPRKKNFSYAKFLGEQIKTAGASGILRSCES